MTTKQRKITQVTHVDLLTCPSCNSEEVTLTEEQIFLANTLDHYCHSVKVQDADAKAFCLDCGWTGLHEDLKGFV